MDDVTLRNGESLDSLLSRFRASVTRSRVLREWKEHRFFSSKAQKARLAARRATRRYRRRQRLD